LKNLIDIQSFQQFDNLEFIAKHVVEGFITGLHRSPFHGFSVEFAEHRLYNTGESTKHIDWKLFARTDKLFVKKYEEETNLRCHIVVDTSSSMYFPFKEKQVQSKLAFSVVCASALIYLLRKQRDAVALSLFASELDMHTDARLSMVHAQLLYAKLEELFHKVIDAKSPPLGDTFASNCIHEIAEKIHKRSLVIIFSDMFEHGNIEDLFTALQHLKYKKHDVVLFHVVDRQKEENFTYTNRPYKFIDMESGEEVKINPNDIRENYVTAIKSFFNELKLRCGQYNIDLIEADINADFREVLLPYLIKRSKLY
jgi:uncharacterized protein (DUF58 family)